MGSELFYNAYLCEALYFRSGALKSPRRKYSRKAITKLPLIPFIRLQCYAYYNIAQYLLKENQNLAILYNIIRVWVQKGLFKYGLISKRRPEDQSHTSCRVWRTHSTLFYLFIMMCYGFRDFTLGSHRAVIRGYAIILYTARQNHYIKEKTVLHIAWRVQFVCVYVNRFLVWSSTTKYYVIGTSKISDGVNSIPSLALASMNI